jgi:cytochrome c oxidase subunit 3
MPSEPFRSATQQREARLMGMYIFLGTEIMLFGGLFLTIFIMRLLHSHEVVLASKQLDVWLGAINTLVLLTSSAAVALGVEAARGGEKNKTVWYLAGAALLGFVFLGIKTMEYSSEAEEGLLPLFSDPVAIIGYVGQQFMNLYLISTSLHAVHLVIGIIILVFIAWRVGRGSTLVPDNATAVAIGGLFWHFVDVVWVFLYPSLYLAR